MSLDGAAFASWLMEQGTIPSYVASYVEAAIRLSETAPTEPVEPGHIETFIARLGGENVADERLELFRRAGAALLRYQSTASTGRVTFSGIDQSSVAAALERPAADAGAPYLTTGDIPDRPLPRSRPIPRDAFLQRARVHRIVLSVVVVVVMVPAIFTMKATVDAFHHRSQAVTPDFYSDHLHTDIRFPPDKGWRHVTGADRIARYDLLLPHLSGRSMAAEVASSTFYRGEDPDQPDFGLWVAVMPLVMEAGDAATSTDLRTKVGETLSKLVSETLAVRGGTWSKHACGSYDADPRSPVTCFGEGRLEGRNLAVDSWVIFGADHVAVAVFRATEPNEERRREAASIVTGIRF